MRAIVDQEDADLQAGRKTWLQQENEEVEGEGCAELRRRLVQMWEKQGSRVAGLEVLKLYGEAGISLH